MKKCQYCKSINSDNVFVCARCGASKFDELPSEPSKTFDITPQQTVTHNYYYYNQNVPQQTDITSEYERSDDPPKRYWGLKLIGWLFLILQVLLIMVDFGTYSKLFVSVAFTVIALRKKKWLLLFIAIFLWIILIGS